MRRFLNIALAAAISSLLLSAAWTTSQEALAPTQIIGGRSKSAVIDLTAADFVLVQVEITKHPGSGAVHLKLFKSVDGTRFDSAPFIDDQFNASTVESYQLSGKTIPFVKVEIKHAGNEGYINAGVRFASASYR